MIDTEDLANRIARLIRSESVTDDRTLIHQTLSELTERLENLEHIVSSLNPKTAIHPSMEHFDLSDASMLAVDKLDQKTCRFEPNDRPCDNCSMCGSRGF